MKNITVKQMIELALENYIRSYGWNSTKRDKYTYISTYIANVYGITINPDILTAQLNQPFEIQVRFTQ